MQQRLNLALEALQEGANISDLCREFGISRPTAYKWKQRFIKDGFAGLNDQSRKPNHCSSSLSEQVVCRLVKLKHHHATWGPKKIQVLYERSYGNPPSLSSVKRVLERAGLVQKRRKRSLVQSGRIHSNLVAKDCNEVWTVDFKGWWRLHDSTRCEPLTVRDEYSRYILDVRILKDCGSDAVKTGFEALFERYGLPKAIRSDNGIPFACTSAPCGLSRLSAWWLALGIGLERGRPGKPQDNSAHERMHLDIMRELEACAKGNAREQQAAFDIWRNTFNLQRPHEALNMMTPSEIYKNSTRKYSNKPIDIDYKNMMTRRVGPSGLIKIQNIPIRISTALRGYTVGLVPIDNISFEVYFAQLPIGQIDLESQTLLRADIGPQQALDKNRYA